MELLRRLMGLSILLVVILCTRCANVMNFQKCNCIVHNHQIIQNTTCWAKAVSRTSTVLNIRFWVTREVGEIFVNGALHKRSVVSFKPFLVNVTENFCDFVEKNHGGFYLRLIEPVYKPYSNLNHSCPYSGLISLTDMPLHMNKLVSIWPEGVYRVDILVMEGRTDSLITFQIFFELK